MSSLTVERVDSQRPTHQHLPAAKVASSGPDVVEFAASAGLILDDWQEWVLVEALAERADGKWAAFEACVIVPRQNGKGSILEALEIYHLFVLGSRLIVHSAHEFKTAREHFLRMQSLIKGCPDLYEQVCPGSGGYIHTGAGSESIATASGARLNFIARSRGSGRGFSGDLVVLDEAFNLPVEAVGAMGPALSAMPNPQVWYTSSAPHSDSRVLHGVRKRGHSQQGQRLFFAEWANEPGVNKADLDARARVNPGYPHRLTDDNLDAEAEMLQELDDELIRERFGVPSLEDNGAGVFGPGRWQACSDPASKIVGSRIIALDIAPGMGFASFGAAGIRADGLAHGELIERRPGTGWVIERAKDLNAKWGPVAVDPKGPVGGLIEDLEAAGVTLLKMPDGEMPNACTALQEKVQEGTFRHLGQAPLDAAVAGAAIRTVGDTWRWTRTGSSADITPIVVVTVALWASGQQVAPAEIIII
jgi:hypothetical protein